MAIIDELGGRAVVELVVDLFYRRILADPRLAPHFADVDLAAQMGRQCLFLSLALGRAAGYDGGTIRATHQRLGLGDSDFDRVAGHLAGALGDVGAPSGLIDRVLAIVETTRPDIVAAE